MDNEELEESANKASLDNQKETEELENEGNQFEAELDTKDKEAT